ncbi:hypothetical protein GCM10011532_27360 [Christiangramia forsetii]|nr:hypothetical protein GCM10011532_27360 [Christiangramia forsetii]
MIMPKRLIFDGTQRSQEINLVNTGSDSATYAISFIQYRMKENGEFEQISKPDENQRFADSFLRYYPRRVSLAAKEAQTVRLQVTRTNSMEEGEYRSHLYFRAVEDQTALGSETNKEEENNISINIKTVFGISIPVILRKGKSNTEIRLKNVSLETLEQPILSLDIERDGNMSVYGNLDVEYQYENLKPVKVGIVKGIAVYTPNNVRTFSFQLQDSENIDLSKGKLLVSYSNDTGKKLASTVYELE